MSAEHFDAIVVGSGFGGSVSAYRLAEGGLNVCLLERGKAYPPGSFPRSPDGLKDNFWDPSEGLYGMFNVWSFRHLEAVVSSALGGGSIIYANVLLRKDEKWFVKEDPEAGGYEYWPVTRADLDPHYEAVEEMLEPQRYPFDSERGPYRTTPKTHALKEAAGALDLDWHLPPLGITFANPGEDPVPGEPIEEARGNLHGRARSTCRLCGECDAGCNYGSKNTLDYNYLSAAKRIGADLRTLCEVRRFAPRPGGGYTVGYVEHDLAREGQRAGSRQLPLVEITCDRLILSAGTLGTTYLLLKNRGAFPDLSAQLGTRFCGNGDLLSFAYDARKNGRPHVLDPNFGPVITSTIRVADALDGGEGRGFYIQDAGYPAFMSWIVESANPVGATRRFLRFAAGRLRARLTGDPESNLSAEVRALLGDTASSTTLPLLGMGRDTPDGRMRLRDGWLDVDWHMHSSRDYFERVRDTMQDIADTWGAQFMINPTWLLRRVITVHALGGCPMARAPEEGVVDAYGEVFNYPDLYVADGSIMPGPVGANPALTIAALADRTADRILEKRRNTSRSEATMPAGPAP